MFVPNQKTSLNFFCSLFFFVEVYCLFGLIQMLISKLFHVDLKMTFALFF